MEIVISKDSLRCYQQETYRSFYRLDDKYIVQPAKFSDQLMTFPIQNALPDLLNEFQLVFLETDYNPISRIKRGKFFKANNESTLILKKVSGDLSWLENNNDKSWPSVETKPFTSYYPCREKFNLPKSVIYLGNSYFSTRWKILSIDSSATNEEIFVLQETLGIGAIPNIDYSKINFNFHIEIEREFNSLLSEVNGHPESVVEHCKSLVVSTLSAFLNLEKEQDFDISPLIKKIQEKEQVKNYADIVRIFHSRCKPNKIRSKDYREIDRYDSDYAIYSTFQILKELDWIIKST